MSVVRLSLREKLRTHDLVVVSILDAPRFQVLRTRVERIYSCRNGIALEHLESEIEFLSAPSTWGNEPLQVTERAMLFVRLDSDGFNEYVWRGHLVLAEFDGVQCATIPFPEVWMDEDLPLAVRTTARQHPTNNARSIVNLDALNAHLSELLKAHE